MGDGADCSHINTGMVCAPGGGIKGDIHSGERARNPGRTHILLRFSLNQSVELNPKMPTPLRRGGKSKTIFTDPAGPLVSGS